MNYGTRSHLPEHCTKEFLDTMRLTALTAEELPAILYAGGFAAELALENPNLPLSALQNTKAITEPDLEVVGGPGRDRPLAFRPRVVPRTRAAVQAPARRACCPR